MPAKSGLPTHLFLSKTGRMLDTWQQAFPHAISLPLDQLSEAELPIQLLQTPDCIWLRLYHDATVANQVALVRKRFPSSRLLILSDIPNDLEALAGFSVAAKAYCNSHAGVEVLHNIANVVMQGGLWIGESIMQRLLTSPGLDVASSAVAVSHQSTADTSTNAHWNRQLTDREQEVAQAVAVGASNREIATTLQISERTVKAHVSAILDKLQIKSRLQLALIVKNSQSY